MNFNRPLGVGALIVGAVLLGFGYHFSGAPIDQVSNTLTGHYTDNTMWYLIVGFVLLVGGSVTAIFGKRA